MATETVGAYLGASELLSVREEYGGKQKARHIGRALSSRVEASLGPVHGVICSAPLKKNPWPKEASRLSGSASARRGLC